MLAAVFGILSLPITIPAAIVVLAIGIALAAIVLAVVVSAVAVIFACAASAFLVGFNADAFSDYRRRYRSHVPVLLGMSLMSLGLAVLFAALFWLVLKLLARLISWAGRGIYRLFAGKKTGRQNNMAVKIMAGVGAALFLVGIILTCATMFSQTLPGAKCGCVGGISSACRCTVPGRQLAAWAGMDPV